jgi:hypothetical protein
MSSAGGEDGCPIELVTLYTPHYVVDNPPIEVDERRDPIRVDGTEVTVGTKTYVLNDIQAAFVKRLVEAGVGNWVAGPDMGKQFKSRPDRVFSKLPSAIKNKLESSGGKGFRIKPA